MPGKSVKYILLSAIVFVVGGFAVWSYGELSKPLPGEAAADLGREHVAVGTEVPYNSNPPTSGPHYSDWTRAGIYDEEIEDGYLIHSLEHGYIVFSYRDPEFKEELVRVVQNLPRWNWKIIVVPRENLDVSLALTAWGRILKLESIEETQIDDFVSTFRNAGPEQTME
ncbi:DUF3105 domain-containing protein [Candidatus Saccharibacteria bacterium]|nr:DUF3105 domain-containing protein [Candidatus Saccharibacteria bacterium]